MTYMPNPAFAAQMEASPLMRAYLEGKTGEAAEAIRRVGAGLSAEGDDEFARSISVDGTRVVSSDEAAAIIEFGSEDTPPHAPFRKGVEMIGARWTGEVDA